MGITCAEVGGIWDLSGSRYSPGATPCSYKKLYEPIAGYVPSSQVTDHNALDLDQEDFEHELTEDDGANFIAARAIYEKGGNSKSYAEFTVDALRTSLVKGLRVTGKSSTGAEVVGYVYEDTPKDAVLLRVQYKTNDVQANYVGCRVGGLEGYHRTTRGCYGLATSLTIATTPVKTTIVATAVEHKNGRTLQGFSTNAQALMYDNCPGCPYKHYKMFYDYYGDFDYAD
eukprot:335508-Pleurochrysis_carterae.AAC.1